MTPRDPRRTVRLALVLWLTLAVLVWTVVFDRMIVVAGRQYVHDAAVSARSGSFLLINDRMPQATSHAVRVASLASAATLASGVAAIWIAARKDRGSAARALARGGLVE